MKINERLFNLRREKNLSQEELANVLGVSRQTISKWETGESTPDFDKIIPLCNFYGITSDELLSGKKDIVEAKKEEIKNNFARNIAISVGLYILSLVAVILFAETFFTIIAIATSIIVYSAIKYSNKEEKNEKEKKENGVVKQVCDIIGLIGVIIYFLISFLTGAWHITWIIFIIIGLCDSVVKLLFSLKGDNNNE